MNLKSIAIRAGLATAGVLCGGILGGFVASIVIFALPLEGVFAPMELSWAPQLELESDTALIVHFFNANLKVVDDSIDG